MIMYFRIYIIFLQEDECTLKNISKHAVGYYSAGHFILPVQPLKLHTICNETNFKFKNLLYIYCTHVTINN